MSVSVFVQTAPLLLSWKRLFSAFQPDQAILVTDGAEDESVLPIITSQVRIDHVEKIIVRQSKGIRRHVYYIVKALEDPKWRSKIMIPFGAVMRAFWDSGSCYQMKLEASSSAHFHSCSALHFSKGAGIESTVNRSFKKCEKTLMPPCFIPSLDSDAV